MLTLIEDRLARKVFDDALEVAWSTMWNVTDETAVNCQRFLDGRGMEFFLGCLNVSCCHCTHISPYYIRNGELVLEPLTGASLLLFGCLEFLESVCWKIV
jgi:hypothetical protein